jgi:hypothetical protein
MGRTKSKPIRGGRSGRSDAATANRAVNDAESPVRLYDSDSSATSSSQAPSSARKHARVVSSPLVFVVGAAAPHDAERDVFLARLALAPSALAALSLALTDGSPAPDLCVGAASARDVLDADSECVFVWRRAARGGRPLDAHIALQSGCSGGAWRAGAADAALCGLPAAAREALLRLAELGLVAVRVSGGERPAIDVYVCPGAFSRFGGDAEPFFAEPVAPIDAARPPGSAAPRGDGVRALWATLLGARAILSSEEGELGEGRASADECVLTEASQSVCAA